ncbi:unnamed protein product, partial [Closterium sp. NIES-53]
LWLHQQSYADKLRRHFIDKEQNGCIPKLTFDDKDAQESEEEYQQKVGSLQFVAMTTRPNISFACSKLGSGLVVRSNQHWRKIDRCLAYLSDTRDTALEFGGGAQLLNLVGYVDADDTSDKQNWTSTGGYVFLQDAGTPTILRADNKLAITVSEGLGLQGNLKHMERRYAWLHAEEERGDERREVEGGAWDEMLPVGIGVFLEL